ncbi:MAG: LacI family DNA-binding transcriptional regulator [Clostridia bacterium]|nr:LacI family DNA-binding transcriptional regulator [Clostridia bacterium]
MEKRITIKDIAKQAGVSLGTVHCALNGKSGVGEETRARVIAIANEMGYRVNGAAASLKRGPLRIAAAFPGLTTESQYYFSFVWEGVRAYIDTLLDYNVELLETPFYGGANNQTNALSALLKDERIDGLLTTGYTEVCGRVSLREFEERHVPVVLVGNDVPQSSRLCCVQPHYRIIGRTLAELLSRQTSGGILLLSGDVMDPSHYQVVGGFDEYVQEHALPNPIYKVHLSGGNAEAYARVLRELAQNGDIAACCAVNARGSVLLGNALCETGKAGRIPAVGSDLFAENVRFLKDGVFTNLLYKKPYSQAYTATKYLADFLLRGARPANDVIYLGNEVIFQSSLPMYDNGLFRLIR